MDRRDAGTFRFILKLPRGGCLIFLLILFGCQSTGTGKTGNIPETQNSIPVITQIPRSPAADAGEATGSPQPAALSTQKPFSESTPSQEPPPASTHDPRAGSTPSPEPAQTSLGIPSGKVGDLNIPIVIGIYSESDVAIFNKYATEQDLIAARSEFIPYLEDVKVGQKMLVLSPRDEPLDNFRSVISQASAYQVSSLGYNLETALPSAELIRKEKEVGDLAQQAGLLYAFAPTLLKLSNHYPDFAKNADVIILQAQRFQTTATFENQTEDLIAQIKSSNPKVKVWVQVSVNPPEDRQIDPQVVIQQIYSIADRADLIWIFYAPRNAPVLEEVLEGLRHSETQETGELTLSSAWE